MTVLTIRSAHSPSGGPDGLPPSSKSPHLKPAAFVFNTLPEDIIQLLFYPLPGEGGRRLYLPPTALVEFACTCKAAAAIALPALYSNLFLPSLPALPQVFATLASPGSPFLASLKLLDHVRSATVSPHFASKDQFHLLSQAFQTGCKLDKDSWIVSTDLVNQRFTGESRGKWPMHWFIRIAALCPQLVSFDLSNLPNLGRSSPLFLYGFQSLANILRARGGRFTSVNDMPVSAVLVNDDKNRDGEFVHDVYFVTRLDWGRNEIDVANYVNQRDMASVPDKPDMDPAHFCLVPFSDIVGGAEEQAQWAIRDISIRVVNREWLALLADDSRKDDRDWIESEAQLYKRAGIRKGMDRVFDLNPASAASRPTIKGKITVATPYLQELREMMQARGFEPKSQCTRVDLHGSNTMVSWMTLMNKPEEFKIQAAEKVALLGQLSLNPMFALARFAVHDAFFFTADQTESALESMSKAMPNLLNLSLLNLQVPMDFVLMSIDTHFIRRMPQDGKRLQHLRVSCFCPMHEDPVWFNASAVNLAIKAASEKMSDVRLDATMHLRTLTLEASGSTYSLSHQKQPRVAIHPDLLHRLESLTLNMVKLVQIPPDILRVTRRAFLPAVRTVACKPPSAFHTVEHATLPNLRRLQLSTSSLIAIGPGCDILFRPGDDRPLYPPTSLPGQDPAHRLPKSLPSCPHLAELVITPDGAQTGLSAPLVASILATYATLVSAQLAYTRMSKAELQLLARTLWDPALCTHPRLRNLVLDDMGHSGGCMRYMSMPHVLHTDDRAAQPLAVAADPPPTSVEADLRPVRPWCDKDGALVECEKCRMKVRVESYDLRRGGAQGLFMSMAYDESDDESDKEEEEEDLGSDRVRSTLACDRLCPNCAPGGLDRVWIMKSGTDVEKPRASAVEEEVVDDAEGDDDGEWEDWCSDDGSSEEDGGEWKPPGANKAMVGVAKMWGIKMRFPGEF